MRRVLVLALLLGAMQLILPLGAVGYGSEALLAFGFLILAAYTVGELAMPLGLPRILGYLVAGVLFGPHVLGTVSEAGVSRLTAVSRLAIALIAFLAGAELRWSEVRDRGIAILKIMSVELGITFLALAAFLYAARGALPVFHDAPAVEVVAFSILFAAIAIVHSPAVTMALLTETGAKGPVARTTLGIVLVSDVLVVLVFSAALAVARWWVPPTQGAIAVSVGAALWKIGGALLIGGLLGAGTALYLRAIRRELLLFAVLIAFFGAEIAELVQVEVMLTLLTAGFVAQNLSVGGEGELLREAMERSAAPVIVVFFAMAGTKIDVIQVAALLPFVIPIAVVRAGAIWTGTWIGSRWAGVSEPERRYVWLGLVSQAGVAIALVTIFADAYPERGAPLRTILLSLIAVNEMLGPILFRRALVKSGEAPPAAVKPRIESPVGA